MNKTDPKAPVHHDVGEQVMFTYAFSEPPNKRTVDNIFSKGIIRSNCSVIPGKSMRVGNTQYKILMESSAVLYSIDDAVSGDHIVIGDIFTCGETAHPSHGEKFMREQLALKNLAPKHSQVYGIARGASVVYEGAKLDAISKVQAEPHVLAQHMVLNYGGIAAKVLNNEQGLISIFDAAIRAGGVKLLEQRTHKFQPQGVTIISVYGNMPEEVLGYVSIHSYPEWGSAMIDVFGLGNANERIGGMARSLEVSLEPTKQSTLMVARSHPGYTLASPANEDPFGMKSYAERQ